MGAQTSVFNAQFPFVLSMTTTPWRLNQDLVKRVTTLLDALPQNYSLTMNIPHVLKRDNSTYPSVPDELTNHPRILIHRVEDQGPITKVLPTLKRLMGSSSIIVVIDDDIVYAPDYIRALTSNYKQDESSFVSANVSFPWHGIRVPEGFKGYAIPAQVVTPMLLHDLETFGTVPGTPCFTSDDFVIGMMLRKHGIKTKGFSLIGITPINVSASNADPRGLRTQNHWNMYGRCKAQLDGRPFKK